MYQSREKRVEDHYIKVHFLSITATTRKLWKTPFLCICLFSLTLNLYLYPFPSILTSGTTHLSTKTSILSYFHAFPVGWNDKESIYNVGVLGSIPGLGRSPGEGNGNPLQYSCLKNSMDRGAWRATVHGVKKLDMTEWLTLTFILWTPCSIEVFITAWCNQ